MSDVLQALTGVLQGLSIQQIPLEVKLSKFKGLPRAPGELSLTEWLDDLSTYSNHYKFEGRAKAQAVNDHLGEAAK